MRTAKSQAGELLLDDADAEWGVIGWQARFGWLGRFGFIHVDAVELIVG